MLAPVTGGTLVRKSVRRRLRWALAAFAVLLLSLGVVAWWIAPQIAASKVRRAVAEKVQARLGRTAAIGEVSVGWGTSTLRKLTLSGPRDGAEPFVTIDRVDISFAPMAALFGDVQVASVAIDGVNVNAWRGKDGRDNWRDLVDRFRAPRVEPAGKAKALPAVSIRGLRAALRDEVLGIDAAFGSAEATVLHGLINATLRDVSAKAASGQALAIAEVAVTRAPGHAPSVRLKDGQVAVWPKLAFSGVAGSIAADEEVAGRVRIDLAGGYGGVATQLWTARGHVLPAASAFVLDINAEKFHLDRLAPILKDAGLIDYAKTTVDAELHIESTRAETAFSGDFHVDDLTVRHPMLADRPVRGLAFSGEVAGRFDRGTRVVELVKGNFLSQGLPFAFTGAVALAGKLADGTMRVARQIDAQFVVPATSCQTVLSAIPAEMAPYLSGYKLGGSFDTSVKLHIDWANLDATQLTGRVGIRNCKVVQRPEDSPARLREAFEHYVEVEKGEWISFEVGPDNPDFVPFAEISPYVVRSIMSTEDSAFYSHHGFIPSEFRTALVNNLKAGRFRYGASSITMQLVKNALLYRKKTLARKLQELFLTWDVENVLSKDRILEIYLNVIEYGPGLYGIGPAAQHYFGKAAKDLAPQEAAFFSSILPAPKPRYMQYCDGTLSKWTEGKISRILAIMLKRGRLTQEEYDTAVLQPLLFTKDGSESPEDCRDRTSRAVKNARSTNPLEK